MSIAAAQASKFYEQAVLEGRVFTFTNAEEYLVFLIRDQDVVPFWSSRSRLESIRKIHPKYTNYSITEVPLSEFLQETLPLLESEGIHIGVNWSGKGLTGYDVSVHDLRRNLGYWIEKQEKMANQAL